MKNKIESQFEYRGYSGSVTTSIPDMCLHGTILFIEDLVTYQAQTLPDLKQEFHAAVDDYIQTCEELGRAPEKPFKGSFNIRISAEDHKNAALRAKKAGKTLNTFVADCIHDKLAEKAWPVVTNHYSINIGTSRIETATLEINSESGATRGLGIANPAVSSNTGNVFPFKLKKSYG